LGENGQLVTTTTTYKIQFQGSHPPFMIGHLWKANAEPKVKLFGWTAMHQKLPTAETLVTRGMQTSQVCAIYNSNAEDAHHLLTEYPFSR
jgi:hypothetical protein